MKVWVDHMYVRIAEITSTSDMQFKMLMAFVENVLLPRNIEAGQLSGEIFRTSDNSCFVVSRFSSKEEADKIMLIMKAEMEELRGNNRIRFIEGERFFHLSRNDWKSSQEVASIGRSVKLNTPLHSHHLLPVVCDEFQQLDGCLLVCTLLGKDFFNISILKANI